MGAKRILLVEGHPDIHSAHLCGAQGQGGAAGVPLLRSQQE
jgi:hypothetical protein